MNDLSKYNDLELLRMMKSDKKSCEIAFAEIYSRYSQKVYAYYLRTLDETDPITDLYQDTFVKFYERYAYTPDVSNILGLLLRISRNLTINYKRDKKYQIELDENDYPTLDKDDISDEENFYIEYALKSLDDELRELFVLKYYEDMTYEQISDLTGLNSSTIRTKVSRAKEKLKNLLTPYIEELR
ncbi:RNA polymerase sigma factor [Candidatus Kapaibacterium sp.]